MNDELQDLESSLSALRPLRTDDVLLDRLESAADGSLTELTVAELRFEALLGESRPSALPADFLASLEKVVATTPFPVGQNIVMFTKGNVAPKSIRRFRPYAAAAAVAVLGALTALMMPTGTTSHSPTAGGPVAANPTSAPRGPIQTAPRGLVPASFGSNVQSASDEGVVWRENRPHRVVRVIYKQKASFINAEGKRVEVEVPREEYILVPEKVD